MTMFPIDILIIVAMYIAIILDFKFGDPSNKYHPVAWCGNIINKFIPTLKGKNENKIKEQVNGIFFLFVCAFISVTIIQILLTVIINTASGYVLSILIIILFSIILKSSVAIKGMDDHVKRILTHVENQDLEKAKQALSLIVRRDTMNLDRQHLLSGVIECVGESIVDGVTGPLFYYSIFGPAGAFLYRIINTLDSIIGYRDKYYINIGYMTAKSDTVFNYLPARITAILIILTSKLSNDDWRNAFKIMKRDCHNTLSTNAGFPMSAMAGALHVQLEKIDNYVLGDNDQEITIEKCRKSVFIMKVTTILFCIFVATPIILLLMYIGWWNIIL